MTTASLGGHPNQLIPQEEAEIQLAPHRERLERCIQHGWDVWRTDYAHKRHILSARARAAIVFDEIVARALDEFQEGPDLKVRRSSNSFMLYIGIRLFSDSRRSERMGGAAIF
jgi:hypothetical protein